MSDIEISNLRPKISVVVAVYNAELFLPQCLDSILNQTLKEMEVICVDDASTDRSLEILKQYQEQDNRIIVIEQEHAGAGAARNKGMQAARGEYLSVLDADDFFDRDMLRLAYTAAEEQKADIVVFRCDQYDHQKEAFSACDWSIMPWMLKNNPFCASDIPDRIFNIGCGWAWDKLYRRDFVSRNEMTFQEIRSTNDMLFVYYLYTKADRIFVINPVLAHHRINMKKSLSMTREKSWDNCYLALKALKDKLTDDGIYETYKQSFVNWALNLILWHIDTLEPEAAEKLKQKCREEFFDSLDITGNEYTYYYNKKEYNRMKTIMDGSAKVSVIMPVYQAGDYLHQSMDSLINQTLYNIEILCVDDGSTDNSLEILQEYEKRDERVHVITKEHSNAGDARNMGLDAASGEYLAFLDADDFAAPDMLEKAYLAAKEADADICLFRCNQYDHNSGDFRECPWTMRTWEMPEQRPFSAQDVSGKIFNMSSCTPWDKLFKTSLIREKGIRFQSVSSSNDMVFTFSAFTQSRRFITLEDILVHQRVGHPRYLSEDIEYMTSNYYKALMGVKNFLSDNGIYDEYKKSFINWGLDFSLWNMHNFGGHFGELVKQQLKQRYFADMDICNASEEDFYNHDQYVEMREIMESGLAANNISGNPKVSVIIPIYNVEQYLRLCLDSAVYQTMHNIEIICVDDGSTDSCLDIIREYEKMDSRIVVITGPNGGYGHAMNQGLDRARGEYIAILEPDDYVDVRMYEELYQIAIENELDYVKGDFYRFTHDERGNQIVSYHMVAKEQSNYEIVKNPAVDSDVFRYMMNTWSGIYKRDFLERNHIRHNETPGASFQDNGFWFQTLVFASRIMVHNFPYYYNRRDNPNSSVASKAKVYCMNEEYALIRNRLKEYPELEKKYIYQYNTKRFLNYLFTYNRLAPEFKLEYLTAFHKELKEADEAGEVAWYLFTKQEKEELKMVLEEPEMFPSVYRIRKYKGEIEKLQREVAGLKKDKKNIEDEYRDKLDFFLSSFYTANGKRRTNTGRNKPVKQDNRIVHLAFISDQNYCMPTSVALTSLKLNKNYDTVYKIHVMSSGIDEDGKARLMQLSSDDFQIDLMDVQEDPRFSGYTKGDGDLHVSTAAIIKLRIPQLLPYVGKVLYLDGDILIQDDLLDVYNTDIDGYYVAAVKDIISERNPKHLKNLNYPHTYYFNSGMMLMNLSKMRKDNMTEKLVDYRLHGKNHFMDQDTLNVVLGEKVKFVSPRYNFLNKFYDWWDYMKLSVFYDEQLPSERIEAYRNAVILHLGSHEKPWKYEMGYLSELYDKYYSESPYREIPLTRIPME